MTATTLPERTRALPYPPPWQDLRTLAMHICVGESTIENWVRLGQFPAPRLHGGKRLWQWKEVERHLAGEDDASAASGSTDEQRRITDATRQAAASRR